jgi:cupin fold WbuC family metalloprotein
MEGGFPMSDVPFPLALPAPAGEVVTLTDDLVQAAIVQSRCSPRKRIILPLHKSDDALLHRMFNVLQPGTYIRAHWHRQPPKEESLVVMRGAITVFIFDDSGDIREVIPLTAGSHRFGVDFVAGVCHSFVVRAPDTVVFEVKSGPYQRQTDKDFAPWAPAEGDPEVASFLRRLENACA